MKRNYIAVNHQGIIAGIFDKCVICGSREQLDTHHIKFQCTADENGMIDTMDKDVKNNLVVLYKHHHQEVHKGNIEIEGYVGASVGHN